MSDSWANRRELSDEDYDRMITAMLQGVHSADIDAELTAWLASLPEEPSAHLDKHVQPQASSQNTPGHGGTETRSRIPKYVT